MHASKQAYKIIQRLNDDGPHTCKYAKETSPLLSKPHQRQLNTNHVKLVVWKRKKNPPSKNIAVDAVINGLKCIERMLTANFSCTAKCREVVNKHGL